MSSHSLPYHPATLLRRLAAALYDSLLLVALWMLGTFLILPFYHGEAVPSGSWWYPLYLISITGLFHAWFWSHGGQTLGMRAWRLWVTDETGEIPSFRLGLWRYACSLLAWFSLLGLLWCAIEPRGRAWHDLISHTRITHIPKS